MERDYKPADIAVLLDRIHPYAALDFNSPFPHRFVSIPEYIPTEQEKILLNEYRTNQRLTSAVNAVHRMSYIHLDNAGLDTDEIATMMKIGAIYNSGNQNHSIYHLWQKCLEIESKMSIYDLAPKMGF